MKSNDVVTALGSLAQDTRLAVFRHLIQAGSQGSSAGQIAQGLGVSATTLSFHLNHLRNAGLIRQQRQGRSLIYSADYQAMNGLIDYLTTNCCVNGDCQDPACITETKQEISQ